MIAKGAAVDARKALAWGIIDSIAHDELRDQAIAFARDLPLHVPDLRRSGRRAVAGVTAA